jgi:hypothetical protein
VAGRRAGGVAINQAAYSTAGEPLLETCHELAGSKAVGVLSLVSGVLPRGAHVVGVEPRGIDNRSARSLERRPSFLGISTVDGHAPGLTELEDVCYLVST